MLDYLHDPEADCIDVIRRIRVQSEGGKVTRGQICLTGTYMYKLCTVTMLQISCRLSTSCGSICH